MRPFHITALFAAFAIASCAPAPSPDTPGPAYRSAGSAAEEAAMQEIPTLTVLDNGHIRVHFPRGGCSVLFDHDGTLIRGGKLCDDVTLHRARVAVRAHIAERNADFLDV